MAAKKSPSAKAAKSKPKPRKKLTRSSNRARLAGIADVDDEDIPNLMLTVHVRKGKTKGRGRKWNYDKVMAYVCEKISKGRLVSDVCRKISISVPVFWRIAESTETYRKLYARARKDEAEQMRIYAQKVAEGRDWITLREKKRIAKIRKQKLMGSQMYANVRENNIYARNRLQLDAAKWIAKVTDPEKFGEKSSISLGSTNDGEPISVTLRFVNGKGKEVTP